MHHLTRSVTITCALTWAAPAAAQVAGILGGPGGGDPFAGCDYPTIQDAIDAALQDDVVAVLPGSYVTNLNTFDDVTIAPAIFGFACQVADLSGYHRIDVSPADTTGFDPLLHTNGSGTVKLYGMDLHGGVSFSHGGNIESHGGITLEVHHSTITGGSADNGAGISGSDVSLFNTTLDDNYAVERGGAIYIEEGGTLTMDGASVIGATLGNAAEEGGGIYLETLATAVLGVGTGVSDGVADNGGCIGGDGSVVMQAGSFLDNCTAFGDGGGVYADSVTMSDGAVIEDSNATGDGGGIYARTVDMLGTPVIRVNSANGDGGGIFATEDVLVSGTAAVIEDCIAGGNGGGISAGGDVTLLSSALMQRNTATNGRGGCIDADAVTLEDSSQLLTCGAGTNGGAVFAADLTAIENSSITDGTAGAAGGLAYVTNTATLSGDVTLSDGDATTFGGHLAVFTDGIASISDNVTLSDGTAGTVGGLVYIGVNGALTISDDAALSNGTAGADGGLLYVTIDGTADITNNATLTSGTATGDGGLVYLADGTSTTIGSPLSQVVEQVVLSDGSAGGDGGGIYAIGSPNFATTVVLTGETSVQSSDATYGGGIRSDNARVELYELVQIGKPQAGNTAEVDGGGIYVSGGGDLVVDGEFPDYPPEGMGVPDYGVRVESNTAPGLGGGVALTGSGSTVTATNLVVATNSATGSTGSGGGFALTSGALAALGYVVVQDNAARRGGGAFVEDSTFRFEGTSGGDYCLSLEPNRYCAELTDNRSELVGTVDNLGGALYSTSSAIRLWEVGIQHNLADLDATALYIGPSSVASVRNTLVAATDDTVPTSVVVEDATFDSVMSTYSDVGTTVRYDGTATGSLKGDIFWEMGGAGTGLVVDPMASVIGTCNVGTGVGILGVANTVADPLFVTTARGDYRLDDLLPIVSPALDYCASGPSTDLDGSVRPMNPVDAGAFEM